MSQSAVSRCFRGGASISPATRAKVVQAADALGYAPNKIARSLITQRSRIIAVLVSEATSTNLPNLLVRLGLEVQAAEHRMLTFIMPGQHAGPALPDILAYHVDAVISAVSVPDATMAACAGQRIPVIVYNHISRHPWASSVACDDHAALDELGAHLRTGGSRRIHILAGPQGSAVSESRLRASRDAAAMHGLDVMGITHGDYSYAGGRAAGCDILTAADRPDTIVCANDSMALGVLDACRHDCGMRVPDDVAVAGYDDIPEGARPANRLTTLSQPMEALTRTALRIAWERLDGTAIPGEQRLMPVRLMVRGSTRPVA